MPIDKKPFVSYTLDEEKNDRDDTVFSVRANKKRMRLIDDAKGWMDTDQNSTALWFLVEIGHNVLHNTFGEQQLSYLFKKDRVRRLR